jgi:head-tail adaptor
MAKAGEYDLRVTILPRVLAAKATSGEEVPSWPGPGNDYFAAREGLSAGETIAQGVAQATGSMKLRIRGRAIAVAAEDRLQKKATGELFNITGVWREKGETVILCERVHQQETGQ